jgi:iron complex transport system ATP-binding protein
MKNRLECTGTADGRTDSALRTEALAAGYGKRAVVKNASILVRPGRIVTLVGPNGAGKSTLLKTITRELSPVSGSVVLLERDAASLSERETARLMSMVMTERIHPEYMTCRDVVSTGRYPYTGTFGILSESDWQKTDEAIRAVHAEAVAGQDFSRVSDGQRQRIMLARAICQEPRILVLDEPTQFLDLHYKLDILRTIRRIAVSRRIAVIMSLHELELVSAVSDVAAFLDDEGQIRTVPAENMFDGGMPGRLFHIPESDYRCMEHALRAYAEALRKIVRGA